MWLLKGVREKKGMRWEPQELIYFDSVVGSGEETVSIGIFMAGTLLINGEQLRSHLNWGGGCVCAVENTQC